MIKWSGSTVGISFDYDESTILVEIVKTSQLNSLEAEIETSFHNILVVLLIDILNDKSTGGIFIVG